ncbi:hypothetical protein BANRA_04299 [Acinetobacter baumannii]|nr:hypothetical protein BANRA_04299 [Acinetobacter baumannii]
MGPFFYLTALALLFSWHIFYIHRFNNPMILFLAGMLVISFMIIQPSLPQVYFFKLINLHKSLFRAEKLMELNHEITTTIRPS